MRSEKHIQSQAVCATEEGRKKLLKILQFYDLIEEREQRVSLPIEDPQAIAVVKVLEQLGQGVPPQYILGRALFMGNTFYCTSDTLIPRSETGLLVKTAYAYLEGNKSNASRGQTVIEIGTGCGNIAVSLAMLCGEDVRILASDISAAAVEVARRNVEKHQAGSKVSLFCGDLFEPFHDYQYCVDIVICNPPYIPTTSLKKLGPEIINYEPVVALDGGPYGIVFFRRLINESLHVLKHHGILAFEIGEGQEKLIERLLVNNGDYKDIKFHKYNENIRAISAVKK